MNFNELNELKKADTNVCGGFKCCVDRTCDNTQEDCKECIKDSENAIKLSVEESLDPDDYGDFVILAWLVKKQKEIGHGTMNELIAKAKEYFIGLDQIKCTIPYRRWNLNGTPKDEPPEPIKHSINDLGDNTNYLGDY